LDFDTFFRQLCQCVSLDLDIYGALGYNDVVRLAFEAVQNAYDHANRKPLPPQTRIQSYLSMRYYLKVESKPWDKAFLNYLHRWHQLAKIGEKFHGWVEIVINDDGVGIAARQAQNKNIYWTDDEAETLSLSEALKTGGSIKLNTQELVRKDPGYGFSNIAESLRNMNAFALLRTGRRSVVFDSTTKDVSFKISEDALGYMPGTALQIVFPRRVTGA
jgi:hypothetical protein